MNVPADNDISTIPTIGSKSVKKMPIVIPMGVDMLKHSNKSKLFLKVNPALEKVPPSEIAATMLCKAILMERNNVNWKSFCIPNAIPSNIE